MAADVTVKLDEAAIKALLSEGWVRGQLVAKGDRIVAIAKRTAPRLTGRGANSIHAETTLGSDGWEVRASWDSVHDYMRFQRSHAIQDAAYQVLGK